jgi:hypothetical protein
MSSLSLVKPQPVVGTLLNANPIVTMGFQPLTSNVFNIGNLTNFYATLFANNIDLRNCASGTYAKADGTGCGNPPGSGGTLTGINTPGASGLSGGGSTGTLSMSLAPCPTADVLSSLGISSGYGCSAAGNVSTAPVASQPVVQPVGTTFSVNNFANIYYASPSDNWAVTATVNSGTNVISLTSCPRGLVAFNAVNYPANSAQTYVYISGVGTPEAALITSSTCTQAGGSAGTITFTAANSHGAGTTIGSASLGVQEAINASSQSGPQYNQVGSVVIPPGLYTWQARVTVMSPYLHVDFAGSTITCVMADTCLFIGSTAFPNYVWDVTISNFTGQPGCNNCDFPMIESAGQHSHFIDIHSTNPNPVGSKTSGFSFGSLIQVDNDQSAVIDGLDTQSSRWSHCDTTFCSVGVKGAGGGGNSGILWIKNTNMNLGCAANGVDNQNANTMRISDSVIESQAQFGVRSNGVFSNVPNVELDNVYFEVAGCGSSNPLGIGAAGLIVENGFASVKNSVGPVGAAPLFANTGATQYNYYIVVHSSTGSITSAPFLAGIALTNGSGSIPVVWPQFGTTGTITYDVIRTSGAANSPAPYTAICGGGSTTTCGSVATGLTVGAACSTVGTANICSFSDTASTNTTSYTVTNTPTYYPALGNGTGAGVFWPGSVIATQTSDSVGSSPSPSGVSFDRFGDNVANSTNPVSEPVSSWGALTPRFFAQQCVSSPGGAWVSCPENNTGSSSAPGALTLNEGFGGAAATGLKGRLVFEQGQQFNGSIAGTHKITLVDSNSAKTLSTPGMRPTNDASDTYIGLDNGAATSASGAQLAFGAPVSISNYIANVGDNASYLERLTATLKTFNVAVVTCLPLNNVIHSSCYSSTTTVAALIAMCNASSAIPCHVIGDNMGVSRNVCTTAAANTPCATFGVAASSPTNNNGQHVVLENLGEDWICPTGGNSNTDCLQMGTQGTLRWPNPHGSNLGAGSYPLLSSAASSTYRYLFTNAGVPGQTGSSNFTQTRFDADGILIQPSNTGTTLTAAMAVVGVNGQALVRNFTITGASNTILLYLASSGTSGNINSAIFEDGSIACSGDPGCIPREFVTGPGGNSVNVQLINVGFDGAPLGTGCASGEGALDCADGSTNDTTPTQALIGYRESGGYTEIGGTAPAWVASTQYNLGTVPATTGNWIKPTSNNASNHYYMVQTAGTSGTTQPVWSGAGCTSYTTGATCADGAGSLVWVDVGTQQPGHLLELVNVRDFAMNGFNLGAGNLNTCITMTHANTNLLGLVQIFGNTSGRCQTNVISNLVTGYNLPGTVSDVFYRYCGDQAIGVGCVNDGQFLITGFLSNSSNKTAGLIDQSVGFTTTAMSAQTTATATTITGMAWSLVASKNYTLDCQIPITFAASATVAFTFAGPGSPTSYSLAADGPIGASAAYAQINTFAAASWATATGASGAPGAATEMVHVFAQLQNGTTSSGTQLQLQTKANGTNSITIGANAACHLTQVD